MEDETYTFIQDVKEKGQIARSAFHKKGGKGSRGCKLPYEYLNKSEVDKLNGEVKVVMNLDRPMTWDEFKTLDKDTQEKYLSRLKSIYNVNLASLGNMFGAKPNTIDRYLHDRKMVFPRYGKRMTWQQKSSFEGFCKNSLETIEPDPEPVAPQPTEPLDIKEPRIVIDYDPEIKKPMNESDRSKLQEAVDKINNSFKDMHVTLLDEIAGNNLINLVAALDSKNEQLYSETKTNRDILNEVTSETKFMKYDGTPYFEEPKESKDVCTLGGFSMSFNTTSWDPVFDILKHIPIPEGHTIVISSYKEG